MTYVELKVSLQLYSQILSQILKSYQISHDELSIVFYRFLSASFITVKNIM